MKTKSILLELSVDDYNKLKELAENSQRSLRKQAKTLILERLAGVQIA